MSIEQAIITAIEFEKRVREIYEDALAETNNPEARRVYRLLAEEENGHVSFLEANLNLWRTEKRLSLEGLDQTDPESQRIADGVQKIESSLNMESVRGELEALENALKAEMETGAFYAQLVRELPVEGRAFFERFLEIEQGHVALLEAEISAAKNDGYWFGAKEFDLEKS